MNLALYLSRVRSSEVLEGTRLRSPKLITVPWHYFSGASRPAVTPDRRALAEADVQDAFPCPSGAMPLTLTA
jgi:hypothetical protein